MCNVSLVSAQNIAVFTQWQKVLSKHTRCTAAKAEKWAKYFLCQDKIINISQDIVRHRNQWNV